MARALLSADWYRVAPLKPRLRGHVEVHRQLFRGDIWFILQDLHSGKYHRITPAANYILALMNGRRTMHEIWEAACLRFDDDPPTQSETIRLMSQLHSSDLIASDLPPDMEEIGRRHSKQERQSMIARIKNPMALRLPLLDPDRFLGATVSLVRWLFTPFGFVLWLGLIGAGLVLLGLNWDVLTNGFTDQVLAAENLVLIALAYPIVKALHELGHGYATKVWGGEVHEIGLMFLVFIPVPYVDASASAAFDNKWRRAVVGGAGIMVELALASAALIFWLNAEPGLLRAFAFNVMLIGGISTLLFNGNPLLRFDGYFVFSDLIEIPNLGQRSNKYVFYLIRRYLFGVKDADSPVTAKGERLWLFTYSIAAFIYRLFISFAIALFVASKFFFIGILLACWALFNTFVQPTLKGIRYLFSSPELRQRRGRALGLVGLVLVGVFSFLFTMPAPYTTVAHGVVWLDQDATLRAGTDGFVAQVAPDVDIGQPVVALADPILENRVEILESRLREAQLRLRSVLLTDQVQAQLLRDRVALLEDQLEGLQKRRADLAVTARTPGQVIVPDAGDLDGRLVRQGEVVGYVIGSDDMRLRVAIPQAQAEIVRSRTAGVEVMFQDAIGVPVPARLIAEVPQSQNTIPSRALSTEAGGDIVLNPAGITDLSTLQSVFQFEVATVEPMQISHVGARALVKFDHGFEPIGYRIYRGARQLFLRQFRV
ncbi:putative peptide zinc metalloprotease protein [Yoonia sediminilitoris]|uniref:Putative peptide zinc metalloprotease protein n=2 Tax=Yoonia sediminilitoris TaxID=1286148 RepID=A0A2T6KLH7_9RHOB|nr:putative peptide zinc metalloprotease protein [Yoonia sediminilitoris]RCW97358.1 putative peptide zinc metalloprotease protein [Yoonia sediminilitoris]